MILYYNMISFKYYIFIYCRYIKLSIHYKIRSIKKWSLKPQYERYKYFNPENEKYVIDSKLMSVLSIATDNIDKTYCKDVNRQMFYTKERTKIIKNALQSIFSEPFGKFSLVKASKQSLEDLAVNISYISRTITLWFFLSLPLMLITVILFNLDYMIMEPQLINPTTPPDNADIHLCLSIIVVITLFVIFIYLAIATLIFVLYELILFSCLWVLMSKNSKVVLKEIKI
ncbi:MAG: hypothetical protein IJU54_01580 [Alphaproteobacteria bacterium]|nr:hypothetical protein [Alphaproteobacteria bacterium]